MTKGFKKILTLSIVICGFTYIAECTELGFKDIENKGAKIQVSGKDKLLEEKNTNINTELLLVNKEYVLNKEYIPEGLSVPNIDFAEESDNEEKHVAKSIVDPIENLVNCAKEEGIILVGNSAYRSYESQKSTYRHSVKSQGKELADSYVAKPGFSEHQTGLCIDVTNEDRYFVQGTREADWLAENCHRFGFIIRYPEGKKSITGIEYEPWHIRYVGEEAANYIYNNGITLEEYLG